MRTAYALPVVLLLTACSDALEPRPELPPLVETAQIPGVARSYQVVQLGTLGGASASASGINNRNEVVGTSQNASSDLQAFLWRGGSMEGLAGLGGSFSGANDISNRGWIVGEAETASGEVHPVLWRDGEPTDLGTLGGSFGEALAVNAKGDVVGIAETSTGAFPWPFLWSRGQMQDLPVPPGTQIAWAFGVNNRGDVVGTAAGSFPDGIQVALLWPRDGNVVVLDSPCSESAAFDINARGQTVGAALGCPISTEIVAVNWQGLEFSFLEPLGGLLEDFAAGFQNNGSTEAVNARGQIIGFSDRAASPFERDFAPTLWFRGEPFDLSDVGGGVDINDRGVIAGGSRILIPGAPRGNAQASAAPTQGIQTSVSEIASGKLSTRATPDWARRLCEIRKQVELAGPVTAAAIVAGCP